jgi:phage shock protein A
VHLEETDGELRLRIEDLNSALDIARRNLAEAHRQQEATQERAEELRGKAEKSMANELKYKKKVC